MSDVLPPSSLGSQSLSMPPVQRFCSALSFHRRDFHHLRPLGHRPQRRRSANRRFRPWRPAAAADSLFPAPSAHGGGRRTRRFRRAARWLWLPGCLSFEVLYISIYVNSILMLKNVTGYTTTGSYSFGQCLTATCQLINM